MLPLLELCGSQTSQPRTPALSSGVSSRREISSWLHNLWRFVNVALTPLPSPSPAPRKQPPKGDDSPFPRNDQKRLNSQKSWGLLKRSRTLWSSPPPCPPPASCRF